MTKGLSTAAVADAAAGSAVVVVRGSSCGAEVEG
jgi:hypothetical protein